jgi:hypothetical protein
MLSKYVRATEVIKLHSRVETSLLLATLIRTGALNSRINFTDDKEILQVSYLNFTKSQRVLRHKHLPVYRETRGTAEGWLVLRGKFKAEIFDIDDIHLSNLILKKNDMIILSAGGHSLTSMVNNSRIIEFKNGPYLGDKYDKLSF